MLEQPPVDVRRALEGPAARALTGPVQPLEQLAEHVVAVGCRVAAQALGGVGQKQLREHPEVLGEAAPGDLEGEVARQVRVDSPLHEGDVEARHGVYGLFGEVDRVDLEVRRAPAEEVEGLNALGKLIEHEVDPRWAGTLRHGHRELAGFPDQEAVERAEEHVAGRADALLREARLVPVVEQLLPVDLGQLLGRVLRLHLHEHVAPPEQVRVPAARVVVLEAHVGVLAPSGVVAVE